MKPFIYLTLGWLLHHANRNNKSIQFYELKKRLLARFGQVSGTDTQFLKGKICYNCNGTGAAYDHFYEEVGSCRDCYDGWYKLPKIVLLNRIKMGKYTFHQPLSSTVHIQNVPTGTTTIHGFVQHQHSKWGGFAYTCLLLMFDRPSLLRKIEYNMLAFSSSFVYSIKPKHMLTNLMHMFRFGTSSVPLNDLRNWIIKLAPGTHIPVTVEDEELPF